MSEPTVYVPPPPLIPPGLLAGATIGSPTEEGRIYMRLPGRMGEHGITLRQAIQLQRDLQNAINLAAGWQAGV